MLIAHSYLITMCLLHMMCVTVYILYAGILFSMLFYILPEKFKTLF